MTRLSELDPTAVGRLAADVVYQHLCKQALRLGITDPIPPPSIPELALVVEELTRYAQSGPPACGDALPEDYVQSVVEALYTTAHPDGYARAVTLFTQRTGDPRLAIDVVLLAAQARVAIRDGQDVPIRWLASLASVGLGRLRNLATAGEVATETSGSQRGGVQVVRAVEARRWLSGRGIVA